MSTYSQIYIHIVFAVKGRESLILPTFEEQLYKYITGIVSNKGQKLIAIGGMPDHLHFLIGMKPTCCLSDLVREVKKATNSYIRERKLGRFPFEWQIGYGAFSYGHSNLENVVSYILNQKEHHKRKTFQQEYLEFLKIFHIEYKDEYLFDWLNE